MVLAAFDMAVMLASIANFSVEVGGGQIPLVGTLRRPPLQVWMTFPLPGSAPYPLQQDVLTAA
jgi:hypothetical protein